MINDDELFGSQAKKKNSLNRIGMFEKADKGTLYLEDICEEEWELSVDKVQNVHDEIKDKEWDLGQDLIKKR